MMVLPVAERSAVKITSNYCAKILWEHMVTLILQAATIDRSLMYLPVEVFCDPWDG